MITNYIYDFDGVIINSHLVQEKALEESYKMVGLQGNPPYDAFFRLSGNSLSNIFKHLDLPQEMVPIYRKISRENIDLITLHQGMEEVLKQIKQSGFGCSLCTGKDRYRTLEILQYFHLEKYFDRIVCSDDVEHPKPHPESLLKIMKELNWSANSTCMIGDGVNDILAAKNAGISSIAVTWGDVSENILAEQEPSILVRNSAELLRFIKGERI